MVVNVFWVIDDSSVFQLRVRIFWSYELCERKISCDILEGCIVVSEDNVVSRRSMAEARHCEVLWWCTEVSDFNALNFGLFWVLSWRRHVVYQVSMVPMGALRRMPPREVLKNMDCSEKGEHGRDGCHQNLWCIIEISVSIYLCWYAEHELVDTELLWCCGVP